MSHIKLSVVIPARNEFPNLPHTIYSILHCWESDGFDPKEIEIIVVNNCSDDEKFPQRGTGGTTDYIMPRGMYYNGVVRVIYDPIAGNHSARNKGARIARGKYLFFSDAHMAYKPGFFKHILQAVDESGGIVHGVIQWMGAYPATEWSGGHQYTIKLGEEIKGTWANYKVADTWFYIAAQGHCSVAVNREQFLNFGGYPDIHRTYGGGEFYLNMKWWMFGSTVAVEPRSIGYHLASGRGYTYNHDDYLHNVFNIGKALGMYDWVERFYINCLRRGRKEVLDKMWNEAEKETINDQRFIRKRRKFTFNDILKTRPWDVMNDERHGKHYSGVQIFHDTWLDLLKQAPQYVQDVYNNSKTQQKLAKFINEELSDLVYKRKTPA